MPSRIYDTSAFLRISNKEGGYENILTIIRQEGSNCKASALSAFEFLLAIGRKHGELATTAPVFFENLFDFIPVDFETAQKAASLKLKYANLNLSLADSVILQTGIDHNLEVVTCDRAWAEVKEAKVKIV